MIEIHAVVEGNSEKGFHDGVLRPYWNRRGFHATCSLVIRGKARGGAVAYGHWHDHITRRLKEHRNREEFVVTTMVDLYRLPTDFPNHSQSGDSPNNRAARLEEAWYNDIAGRLKSQGFELSGNRFIPYIQRHELEALLFSDLNCFSAYYPDYEGAVEILRKDVAAFATPEDIDDGPETNPSRRIRNRIPAYSKPGDPVSLLKGLPLETLRERCPHFSRWLAKIERVTATLRNPASGGAQLV